MVLFVDRHQVKPEVHQYLDVFPTLFIAEIEFMNKSRSYGSYLASKTLEKYFSKVLA